MIIVEVSSESSKKIKIKRRKIGGIRRVWNWSKLQVLQILCCCTRGVRTGVVIFQDYWLPTACNSTHSNFRYDFESFAGQFESNHREFAMYIVPVSCLTSSAYFITNQRFSKSAITKIYYLSILQQPNQQHSPHKRYLNEGKYKQESFQHLKWTFSVLKNPINANCLTRVDIILELVFILRLLKIH